MNSLPIPVDFRNGLLVADSRHIAEAIGITNKNAVELIRDHLPHFEALNQVRFETAFGKSTPQGGGNKIKYVLLSEDQSYLLLAFVRNNTKSVPLKVRLIQAFRSVRERLQTLTENQSTAFREIAPEKEKYAEPSVNGSPKTTIVKAHFKSAKNPSAENLKKAHSIYQVLPGQLDFFWALGNGEVAR